MNSLNARHYGECRPQTTGPPIFLLSNARTGSTFIREILDSHPDICSPAELRLGGVCRFLTEIIEFTVGQAQEAAPTEETRQLWFMTVRQIVNDIMEAYCVAKGKIRWCEKTPSNLDNVDYIRAVFPDAMYICLHRHGLDTVHSWLEMERAPSGSVTKYVPPPHMREYVDRNDGDLVAGFIERWCERTERLIAFERTYPQQALRLRFEDFVDAPAEQLVRVCKFIKVEVIPNLIEMSFALRHDDGPGDFKLPMSGTVDATRIGRGLRLDLKGVSKSLRTRLYDLLVALDY